MQGHRAPRVTAGGAQAHPSGQQLPPPDQGTGREGRGSGWRQPSPQFHWLPWSPAEPRRRRTRRWFPWPGSQILDTECVVPCALAPPGFTLPPLVHCDDPAGRGAKDPRPKEMAEPRGAGQVPGGLQEIRPRDHRVWLLHEHKMSMCSVRPFTLGGPVLRSEPPDRHRPGSQVICAKMP